MASRRNVDPIIEALNTVSSISDPRLREIAFEKSIEATIKRDPDTISNIVRLIQILSVVAGVVVSVFSFNASRDSEAAARELEAEASLLESRRFESEKQITEYERQVSAAQPFIELRQAFYMEVVKVAAILSTPESYEREDIEAARNRFRELYIAEASLVEDKKVETKMVDFAKEIYPELAQLNTSQLAAYKLAHSLRDSLVRSWRIEDTIKDSLNETDDSLPDDEFTNFRK